MTDLYEIKDPGFLKEMNTKELNELAFSIRSFLIDSISHTGGHLSSNLGVVELTIAIHKVFDSPRDKIIFDIGHQGYTHKILTGRASDFATLRKHGGLSGYLKHSESVHDCWEAGHSSTAIAALAGFEIARMRDNKDYKCLALVGDGSLNSGLSFEALNFIGHRPGLHPIIILNDNEMSISKNVGSLARLLNSMRTNKAYQKARMIKNVPAFMIDLKNRVARMLRGFAKNMTIFDEFGLSYYGPIDGHDFKTLTKYLNLVKNAKKPCVLHVVTKKGKGYPFAENDIAGSWHGVDPFYVETGLPRTKKAENRTSWSNIVADHLFMKAKNGDKFEIIVPAMVNGSGLKRFQEAFPSMITDVGICESLSVCLAGALSIGGRNVFVPIYSSFLQRAYDQVIHDVARQNLHVIFGIDRAGLVEADGETHQGVYDIAYLSHIPNIEIIQPKDSSEARSLIDYAFEIAKHPVAIRYPKADTDKRNDEICEPILEPSWTVSNIEAENAIITYGDTVTRIENIINRKGFDYAVVNARFIKPIDETTFVSVMENKKNIIVIEENAKIGGLGSLILEKAVELKLDASKISIVALPDEFIGIGTREELENDYSLDDASIVQLLKSSEKPEM
ncbi:MAG TPA: 1-deoxy-D-xylulose-5-phosphate synthase [Bacillota bacterium]|nr:1-deoxy-D-xylulose-5-phosphate synthase [Bacillota bacterium]HPF42408.1 1-deoxy-D-xylulose-5-phosphate synthase [Bacillota bacterium]HPJ85379.1 1-deoxy-D-xylulose-5-phosphate synthase [Bacillota bacterium]HPQ61325.1 1-deoxy-D-xylulose-5-phosphate synthase [Bacillota bacterium]HRX91428.1 1-deoxy-D-xylulose-5-phosphate synthase [Candidatus Izemoplasmatales bacterium]